MKKIIFTISALLIGSVAMAQSKKDVKLEQKTVQDPKKTEVKVVKPKTAVKKAEASQKSNAVRKEEVVVPEKPESKSK